MLDCRLEKEVCRSEEHTSELQSRPHIVCRLLLEKKNMTFSFAFTPKCCCSSTIIISRFLIPSCLLRMAWVLMIFFFFNDTATTEIYTLSLHDALPISCTSAAMGPEPGRSCFWTAMGKPRDRKSTRLNSSHVRISYAVFCLKKKKK